jgi:hypothetical protein
METIHNTCPDQIGNIVPNFRASGLVQAQAFSEHGITLPDTLPSEGTIVGLLLRSGVPIFVILFSRSKLPPADMTCTECLA